MEDVLNKRSVLSFTDATVSYTVDPNLNTCTCMNWKYQRLSVAQRTCKHLDRERDHIEPRVSITTYPQTKVKKETHFQLVHDDIPSSLPSNEYVYSIKYDGVRIRITGHMAITRGGISIDLTNMSLPFAHTLLEYDAELIHMNTPGHTNVMLEINANRIDNLSVRVFDIIDTTLIFTERYNKLLRYVKKPYLVEYAPIRNRAHLSVVVQDVLEVKKEEGVVVRHSQGRYQPGSRRKVNVFKVKHLIG
jgi:ATP-dependent DNA ligase